MFSAASTTATWPTPVNEQGVVLLFGMLAKELDFEIEMVRTAYPDCEAKRKGKDGKWRKVLIEFEFVSSRFDHDPEGCDLIVCWEDDANPTDLEVLELKNYIGRKEETAADPSSEAPSSKESNCQEPHSKAPSPNGASDNGPFARKPVAKKPDSRASNRNAPSRKKARESEHRARNNRQTANPKQQIHKPRLATVQRATQHSAPRNCLPSKDFAQRPSPARAQCPMPDAFPSQSFF